MKFPLAPSKWGWQWVFPAARSYTDRASGHQRRHHLHETVSQRAVKEAARAAGLSAHASLHTHDIVRGGATSAREFLQSPSGGKAAMETSLGVMPIVAIWAAAQGELFEACAGWFSRRWFWQVRVSR